MNLLVGACGMVRVSGSHCFAVQLRDMYRTERKSVGIQTLRGGMGKFNLDMRRKGEICEA